MDLRHLKMIQAVARNGTLSKAGKQLHLTQSALSHQLRELEEELGTPVFHRINRRLVLSHAGKILLQAAGNIMAELELAHQQIRKEISGETGDIKLSTYCYTCYHWLPGVLNQFHKNNKKINIEILPEYTRNPLDGLLNGSLDLVITNLHFDSRKIAYQELFWDQQLAVVSDDHPWAVKSHVMPGDFNDENIIIYYGPFEESTVYQKVLAPHNVKINKVIEMQLTEAAIEMIKNGLGVKVMAAWAIQPYLKEHRLKAIPITPNGLYRTWYLAYLKSVGWKDYFDVFRVHLLKSMRAEN